MLTRDETLKSDEDVILSRWWIAVPSTLTGTRVEIRGGERSDVLLDNETGLNVTVKADWPLLISSWTPADGALGRGARRPVPLHLIYESPQLRLPAGRDVHWRMSLKYLGVK